VLPAGAKALLATLRVTTDGNGHADFRAVVPRRATTPDGLGTVLDASGRTLMATATDSDGNTTEFSAPLRESSAVTPVNRAAGP